MFLDECAGKEPLAQQGLALFSSLLIVLPYKKIALAKSPQNAARGVCNRRTPGCEFLRVTACTRHSH